ncbi:hypothetical protein C2G38_1415915 [Gigaspora rosea]|uniref:Uncharacterized protein n=1 Tax=Gigaspora rosea TaxID=44941 RepID=A0A397VC74_9GLOM|nr:hypothetical protein C2G38_1415915 [Gigaspora rosea]
MSLSDEFLISVAIFQPFLLVTLNINALVATISHTFTIIFQFLLITALFQIPSYSAPFIIFKLVS